MPNIEFEVHANIFPVPDPEQVEELSASLYPAMVAAMMSALSPRLENGESDFGEFDVLGDTNVKVEVTEEGEESSARASLATWGYGPTVYFKGQLEQTLEDSLEAGDGFTISGVEVIVHPCETVAQDSLYG